MTFMDNLELFDEFILKTIKKGEYFLMAGDELKDVALIKSGLFRYFYISPNGTEHTKHFVAEGDFVISFNAFYKNEPSEFFIIAEEDCEVLTITANKLRSLIESSDKWAKLYYNNLEKSFSIKEQRTADFLMKDSTQRYIDFGETYPTVIGRIKQIHMASFLGIKPESLSRIKKNLTYVNVS